jgi:GNAT superfamily N-acetyltransferase
MTEYPPGLLGAISSLFGRSIAISHRVDWTLDAMIAEGQCEFFRRFDPAYDRVWAVMDGATPKGGLTIEGPRPPNESARLRFFILHESLRGQGLGRRLIMEAMQFCRDNHWRRIYLTTLPDLAAASHLYSELGFILVAQATETFHGSSSVELKYECTI